MQLISAHFEAIGFLTMKEKVFATYDVKRLIIPSTSFSFTQAVTDSEAA